MALVVAALLYLKVRIIISRSATYDDFALLTSFALLLSNDVGFKPF